jgi:EAL domain-containing protein (putative c-di-GMP-specific phosphodiesterase class I)
MSLPDETQMPGAAPPDGDPFLEQMERELAGWGDPVARLEHALEHDELVLYAQPILALRGPERFPMAEVLVRLQEEERALLPPGEFFPVFEHFGMLPRLDRWVIRHALARLALGSRVGRLSVNVSGQTLGDAAFHDYVAGELARTGVGAHALVFELSEGDVLAQPAAAERFAASVNGLGCGILIDGFGRRSVSFAPLTRTRADLVKVDGVIVRRLASSETARAKLRAIVRVAQVVRFGVIGECVEEQSALDVLRRCGADYAQGFGIVTPAPLAEVAQGGA